jgi:hypothetical protein
MPKSAAENNSPCHPNSLTKAVIVNSSIKPLTATTAGIIAAPKAQKLQSKIIAGKRKMFIRTFQNVRSEETV